MIIETQGPRVFPEPWASDWGEDEIGFWMAFTFREVRYGFRWIQPGQFLMGSPATEPERLDWEAQHEVTLSQGFWLGETAVTQALWQAVIGENSSYFKEADHPVERVSWDDCQTFIDTLNGEQPSLQLCLPSEAQWEYACRAGSQTPFSFGEGVTTEQVNYDGNYPLKGSPKGEFRKTTVAVKALPANAWGLFQMHGNVFEWCADYLGEYSGGNVVDPSGPDSGRSRVLRGGSWSGLGRICRSACRYGFTPDSRVNEIGFRLARGQPASAK